MTTMTEQQATITDSFDHALSVPGPFHTLAAVREANKLYGHHFFDPDTMRFFRSRIAPGVIAGRIFVTSEQFVPSDGDPGPRRYTIRAAHDKGQVCELSMFQEFPTLAAARAYARRIIAEVTTV